MKRRSPRVVSRPKMPCRGAPPGERHSSRPISAMQAKMKAKKAIVAGVQAIQKPLKRGWVQEKALPAGSLLRLPQPACCARAATGARSVAARRSARI